MYGYDDDHIQILRWREMCKNESESTKMKGDCHEIVAGEERRWDEGKGKGSEGNGKGMKWKMERVLPYQGYDERDCGKKGDMTDASLRQPLSLPDPTVYGRQGEMQER